MRCIKRFSAILCVIVMLACSIAVSAAQPVLVDLASIFDESQSEAITDKLEALSSKTGWSIVVYTSLNGVDADDMDYYYNELYDSQNYGEDGVMFVIDKESNNRIIITKGEAMYYFSDERMDEIKSELRPYLVDDDYFGAVNTFIDVTEQYYDSGKPSGDDFSNIYYSQGKDKSFLGYVKTYLWAFIAVPLVSGAIAVIIVVFRYKNNGKSNTYDLHQNSTLSLTEKQDVFLTKHISVTRIPDNNNRSGGSSGRSTSTHGSSGSF